MNLQFNVPNMTMSKQNFTSNDIRIRGIGIGAIGSAFDAGVGIHVNGVYQTSSRIFEAQFFDTQRVEVLRGPQGTLYGRNTTGGVVNILTAKADPSAFEAQLDGTVGNYSMTQVRGMLNIPLGDNFALRGAAMICTGMALWKTSMTDRISTTVRCGQGVCPSIGRHRTEQK